MKKKKNSYSRRKWLQHFSHFFHLPSVHYHLCHAKSSMLLSYIGIPYNMSLVLSMNFDISTQILIQKRYFQIFIVL